MKLCELLQFKYGKRQENTLSFGKYPIYGTGGIFGYSSKALYNDESILFGRKGSIKNIRYLNKPFWCVDTSFYTIIDKSKVIPKYLYYKLSMIDFDKYNEGTTIPSLRIETLNQIEVIIHPINIQHHIVDTIGSIDDLIEHNNLLIDKLNNFIWLKFLKLKEAINKNVVDNLIMKDLVNITTGKKNANAAVDNGQYAFFTCSLDDYKTDNYCFDCEAIIIAGNGAINVKYYKGKFDAYQRTYVITSNKYFFYCYCLYKDSINSLIAGSKGSVINFITLSMLQEINVKITNESIHETFETECSIIMNSICKLKDKNNQLEQLKKQYLNKFFG